MKQITNIVAIGMLTAGLSFTACQKEKSLSPRPAAAPPAGSTFLEFVTEPEGCQFVAAVKFERIAVIPASEVSDDTMAAYYAEMKPVRLLLGRWDMTKTVSIKSANYLTTSSDKEWIGLLVRDPSGQTRWFSEFSVHEGRLLEGGTEEFVALEKDAVKVLQTYLRENGVRL